MSLVPRTLAVVLTLSLAGCTSEAEVGKHSQPSSSEAPAPAHTQPSPPSEPVQVAPAVPPELSRSDDVGAAAAATYFLRLYGYTMQTGDLEAWDAMSTPTCGFCGRVREFATSVDAGGERFWGADITVKEAFVHPVDELIQAYPVDVKFEQTEGGHIDAQGGVITTSPADTGVFGVDVAHTIEGWKVLAVTAQDAP